MHVDLHVPRFTWPGGPPAIGPTLVTLAQTAEAIGVRTLSVMGVQTVMARSAQADPSRWLQTLWEPVMSELSSLLPR